MAWSFGMWLRKSFIDGAQDNGGHQSYVNYAYGEETLEEMYGTENLGKLQRLKALYDPHNRFRYYAPLVTDNDSYRATNKVSIRDEL
jgi:hypothetical protein